MTTRRASDYSVPRTTLDVEILLARGKPRRGMIFLVPHSPLHAGAETPLELLNRAEAVFPFRADAEGDVLLVVKEQTMRVSTEATDELVDPARLGVVKSLNVELALAEGSQIAGRVAVELPEGHSRLLDYLNDVPAPFFAISDGELIHYVNRDYVLYARPRE